VRRARVDGDAALLGELHCLRVQDLGAGFGQLLHLLVRQLEQAPRVRHHARVGGVDALHVAVDLAGLGIQRRRQGHRRRVGAAAAQRGDLLLVGDALVPGHDDDLAALQLVLHPEGPHLHDARVGVGVVGDDAGLRPREADGRHAAGVERHGQQRHGDALARGEQHVQLAPGGVLGDLLGQGQEVVGRVAHGGDDDHHVLARGLRRRHAVRDLADLVHVRHGRAAVLLDDDRSRHFGSF
jgi:hypothetical protein